MQPATAYSGSVSQYDPMPIPFRDEDISVIGRAKPTPNTHRTAPAGKVGGSAVRFGQVQPPLETACSGHARLQLALIQHLHLLDATDVGRRPL
jgi:hypothetical protein